MPAQPPPNHIDIPPQQPPPGATAANAPANAESEVDAEAEAAPSASRPAPAKGILKNAFRRPSYVGEGQLSPATDAERVQWDEKNIAETEIGKDSLMYVLRFCLFFAVVLSFVALKL